jgi:hypothetical protein
MREAELRRAEIEKKRAERAQNKKNMQNARIGEKRSIDSDEVDGSRKRARNLWSQIRNQQLIAEILKQLNSAVIKYSNDTSNDPVTALNVAELQNAKRWSNFLSLRSGRKSKLPARFR